MKPPHDPSPEPPASDHRHGPRSHRAVIVLLAALAAWGLLPFLGLGTYGTPNGQTFFTMWYLIGFMVIAFFLMHEFITPAPERGGPGALRPARPRGRSTRPGDRRGSAGTSPCRRRGRRA